MRPRVRDLAALGAGLALAAAALAGAEWAARRSRGGAAEPPLGRAFDYGHIEVREPFFRRGMDGGYYARRRFTGERAFAVRKAPGAARVFVVGGSVAMPMDDPRVARLEEFLSRALRGREIEVVGMGMAGYDSEREMPLLREALTHEPDMIVLMSGHNEMHDPPAARPRLLKLNAALRRSTLYRTLQDRLFPPASAPRPTLAERERRFERNLRAMAALARARRVPLVLCTLPSNLRDVAPVFVRPPGDPAYLDARLALEEGALGEAARRFAALAGTRPAEAFAHFGLARALDGLGEAARARRHYARAAELDDPGERCTPRRNAAIRRIARESGAGLADLEALFQGLAPGGLVDARLLKDGVHWHDELYPRVSLAVVKAARAAGALAPPWAWDLSWTPRLEAALPGAASSPGARARAADSAFLAGLSRAFRGSGPGEAAVSYFSMAERHEPGICARLLADPGAVRARLLRDASPWAEEHLAGLEPQWGALLLGAGEAYRRLGRRGAAAALLAWPARRGPERDTARVLLALARGSSAELRALARELPAGQPAGALARAALRRRAAPSGRPVVKKM